MFVSTNWLKGSNPDVSLSITRELALRHARKSGAFAAELVRLIESCNYAALVNYEVRYSDGLNISDVIEARQALGFFQKLDYLDINVDKEAVAYQTFVAAESLCEASNAVFRAARLGRFQFPPRVESQLLSARHKIARVLGRCPDISELHMTFGPGATTSIKRTSSSPTAKMASGLQCSYDLYASGLLPSVLRELPHWTSHLEGDWSIDGDGWLCETLDVDLHHGKLEFVPKTAKTHRSIGVEPCLNSFVQSGIGRHIARRLRDVGIDIRDQTPNQRAAHLGSVDGSLATIDLTSASDTIATELVRYLLPTSWFKLLSAARTSSVRYRKEVITLEKFCSMGNGFTFPLETLIFWALTRSSCPSGYVTVYGDDIICPSECFDDTVVLLRACGFVPNKAKSYATGGFRESCGKDYLRGISVRPYYQRSLVSGQTLFVLHNFYRRNYDEEGCALVLSFIPRPIRIYGPDGYGDGHLVSEEYPRSRKRKLVERGYTGSLFRTFTSKPRFLVTRYPGDYVSPLYTVYVDNGAPLHPLFEGVRERSEIRFSGGRPIWTLPGVDGYKVTEIYTLA